MSVNVIRSTIVLDTVSYIEPVVALSYIDVQVTAEVTMPDRLVVEIVAPSDHAKLHTTKNISDTQSTTDVKSLIFSKSLSDTPALIDAISFGDIQPHRGIFDFTDGFVDVVTKIDTVKNLSDSITMLDNTHAVRLFQREFFDEVVESDVYFSTFDSGETAETAAVFDVSSRATSKALYEGINLVDNMDGDLTYNFIKVIGELFSASDQATVAFTATKADNVATGSSGMMVMQNYCDLTYFLEDYVGVSRTFT